MGVPPLPSPERVRTQLAGLLTRVGATQRTARDGTPAIQPPPAASASPATAFVPSDLFRQVPTSVVRVLAQLQEAGVPVDMLATAHDARRTDRAAAYPSSRDPGESRVQVVSGLLRAVDAGAVRPEDLNAFLTLFAIPPESVRKALTQTGCDADSQRVTLNDAVYRLVSGRLVAAGKQVPDHSSRLWLSTTIAVAALLLLAAAVIRF